MPLNSRRRRLTCSTSRWMVVQYLASGSTYRHVTPPQDRHATRTPHPSQRTRFIFGQGAYLGSCTAFCRTAVLDFAFE
eukprot:2813474-Rhodomonas_salina.1